MIQVSENDARAVSPSVGESFEVRLDEPVTGYKWQLVSDGQPVSRLTGESFDDAKTSPGAGRSHVWAFTANKPGAAAIRFEYRRPWESRHTPAAKTFDLNVRVPD